MLDTDSPFAQAIADLFTITHLIGLGIFCLVAGLVIYCIVRFRAQPGGPEPTAVHGNMRLEIGWTVGAALILVVLLVLSIDTMNRVDPGAGGAIRTDAITVPENGTGVLASAAEQAPAKADLVVIGHQWWWEVRYPDAGVVTANEIHIPTGKNITVQIESADVIHDLWVPQLGRKKDMNPGYTNYITWSATNPGEYLGACAEYCGNQHAWMRVKVVAQSQSDFDAWLANQAKPAVAPAAGSAEARGQQLYQSKTCVSCHVITGVSSANAIGPNLTHVGSRTTIGAGVIDNTLDNLTRWVHNPQDIKPGILMPAVTMSNDELTDLVAYLESLK